MFDYIRFRWELHNLEKEERHADKEYDVKMRAAKARNASDDEIEDLGMEAGHFSFHYQEEIQKLHSKYLLRQAYRLLVPRPEFRKENGMWDQDQEHFAYLSEAGINKLRADIRAERKARAELFAMWMPGVVAILGALIGLVSVLKR